VAELKTIEAFLQLKRIAVIGVSAKKADFSRMLCAEFARRGYDVVPVNPKAEEIEGRRCYGSVADVQPPVEGALILTKPAVTSKVVRECVEAGIRHIWLYRATGAGAVSQDALIYCQAQGVELVSGECPFMFFGKPGFPHNLHGFCRKILGSYPK
jgi:uncharacterized protein